MTLACLLTIGCEPRQALAPDIKVAETVKTTPPAQPSFSPPSFAERINTNTPLGHVVVDFKPLPYKVETSAALSDMLAPFAKDSDSYSVIVLHKGKIVFETYPEPHTSETRAESASMHKSVMSLLIGAAIEDGHIASVDTTIGTYIPEYARDARGQIKIRDLLEISSGLTPLSSEGGRDAPASKFMAQGATARATLMGLQRLESPGRTFHYQNTDSQLLGLVLENATGKSYQDYSSEALWQPIHAKNVRSGSMNRTALPVAMQGSTQGLATGYGSDC